MFSAYEAFALLAGVLLLEHGLSQARVVKVMRLVQRRPGVIRIGCNCVSGMVAASTSRHIARHRSLLTLMAKTSRRFGIPV
jgi:hypothetical protein